MARHISVRRLGQQLRHGGLCITWSLWQSVRPVRPSHTAIQRLDVGSWPSLAKTCPKDENGNSSCGARTPSLDTHDTLTASSDPEHLIAIVGCDDLIIVHTPDATLVCRADRADSLKELHKQVAEKFGEAAV